MGDGRNERAKDTAATHSELNAGRLVWGYRSGSWEESITCCGNESNLSSSSETSPVTTSTKSTPLCVCPFLPLSPLDDAAAINPLLTCPPSADRLKYRHGTYTVHGAPKLVPGFYDGLVRLLPLFYVLLRLICRKSILFYPLGRHLEMGRPVGRLAS